MLFMHGKAGNCQSVFIATQIPNSKPMSTLRRLLAATDFSVFGNYAVCRAALIAEDSGAILHLMHVATLAPLERLRLAVSRTHPDLQQRVLDGAREELRQTGAAILERHGISSSVQVASGPLFQELTGYADALAADLTVLGVRGTTPMRHLLLGSTAERLVGKSRCPVLVVKQPPQEKYRSLLVTVDFSAASLPALLAAHTIAPEAEISLLHVFEVPFEGKLRFAGVDEDEIRYYRSCARQDAMHQLEALCAEAQITSQDVRFIVIDGSPLLNILEQEKIQGCDLIVMGKQGENRLEEMLLGSMTRHVMAESLCDVLVSV